jgi:hypothetical protein
MRKCYIESEWRGISYIQQKEERLIGLLISYCREDIRRDKSEGNTRKKI